MYFQQETYAVVAAFVSGYDAAYEYGMLEGFREWLVLRLSMGSNLVLRTKTRPEEVGPRQLVR
jgi:hypothetical protein